jgi:glycerate kinase
MDSFKGSLNQKELTRVIERKIKEILPDSEIVSLPMADGGEGTVDCFLDNFVTKKIEIKVNDPLMREIDSYYAIKDKTAIIEMAKASGLTLLNDLEKSIMNTTTFGVGEMINDALDKGIKDFIITIGGSATNDGGIGMLHALGTRFFDKNDNLLEPIGKSLIRINRIDISNLDDRLLSSRFEVACDVDNPLFGINGATFVYGKQKGGNKEDILLLDNGLRTYSEIANKLMRVNFTEYPGVGAAGGLGYALKTFLKAKLTPGIDIMLNTSNFESHCKNTDYIITGEGKIDDQSAMGKVLSGIAKIGKKHNIPVIAIAGSIEISNNSLYDLGITSMFSILNKPMSLEEALKKETTIKNVEATIEKIIKQISTKKSY